EGPFWPDHGLERIVAFHERQDARYAEAAAEVSEATGKPVLVATELAVTWPENPGPATVRATGRLCYPSAERAVAAPDHLWRRGRWLGRRGRRRSAPAATRPATWRAGAPRPRRGSDPGRGRPTGAGAAPAGAEGGGCCRPSWRPSPSAPAPARSPSTPTRPPTRPGSTGWWPRRSSPPAAPRRSAPPRWPTAGWRATCWRGWPTRPRTPAWSSRPTAARCWPTTPTSR